MRVLKNSIATRQRDLRDHPLFGQIGAATAVQPLASMARSLAWWPMVFQDLLRLNVQYMQGNEFERFVVHHRHEDAGHDRWYLEDLRAFGVVAPGLDELFDSAFRPIREACYQLMCEVLRDQSDAQRVALLLALEPTGHLFFEQISAAVDRICPEMPLRYFSRSHLVVEKAHEIFEEAINADLDKVVLTDTERAESEAAVARIYEAFSQVFSYLATHLQATSPLFSDIRELGEPGSPARSVRDASGS